MSARSQQIFIRVSGPGLGDENTVANKVLFLFLGGPELVRQTLETRKTQAYMNTVQFHLHGFSKLVTDKTCG